MSKMHDKPHNTWKTVPVIIRLIDKSTLKWQAQELLFIPISLWLFSVLPKAIMLSEIGQSQKDIGYGSTFVKYLK